MRCPKSVTGHNELDPVKKEMQWGGTGVMAHGKMSHFVMGSGKDKSRLGRWSWMRFRGKGQVVLRVVSIYQPNREQDWEGLCGSNTFKPFDTRMMVENPDKPS